MRVFSFLNKYIKDKYVLVLVSVFFVTLLLFLRAWVVADGVSYYSYLPGVFNFKSLNFYTQFEHYSSLQKPWLDFAREFFIKDGTVMHYFSVGPAILAAPFYFVVWVFVKILSFFGVVFLTNPLDFLPYLLSYNLASAFYGFIGLIFAYKLVTKLFSKSVAFWSVLTIWLGSSVINYFYFEASFSHSFTLFGVGLFIYYWWQTYNCRKKYQWLILGLIGGLMALTRWQEVAFISLALIELIILKTSFVKKVQEFFIMIFGVIVAFFPQMIVWKIVYGKWLTIPQGGGFMHLSSPHLFDVLFSTKCGLFTWTPIIFLAFLGLYFLYKKEKTLTKYLIVGLLLQLYINGAAEDWWGGFSFGQRRLVDCSIIFVLGLSGIYSFFEAKGQQLIYKIISIAFIIWNILFLVQYRTHLISGSDYVGFLTVIKNQVLHAPSGLMKLLGQSTFLQKMYYGIFQKNISDLFSAVGVFICYVICIVLVCLIIKIIQKYDRSKNSPQKK